MTDPYRIRSTETWDRAREAYLAGETAEGVCARFDLGLRTFHARAAEQGWRRLDQPDPEPFEIDEDAAFEDIVDDAELRSLARTRMALAARRGLVGEALRWARLDEVIARQAQLKAREDRDLARDLAREQARADHQENQRANALLRNVTATARSIEASARTILATDRASEVLHDLHDRHPVSDGADPDAPLNRADRRRLLKRHQKRR